MYLRSSTSLGPFDSLARVTGHPLSEPSPRPEIQECSTNARTGRHSPPTNRTATMPAAPPSAYATTFATATCAAASAVALLAAAHCTSPVASLAVPHPAVSGANNRSVELYYHSRCPSHARRRGHPSYHRASAREGSGKIVSLSSRLKTSSSNEALLCSRGGSDSASGSKSGGGLEGSEPRCSAAKAADTQQEEDAPAPFVLEGVKNIRDLGSIAGSGIVKGRVFRTGHLSDATEADAITLRDDTCLRTMVRA